MDKKNKGKKQSIFGNSVILQVFTRGDLWTKLSLIIMGAANLKRKQIIKGILFLLTEVAFVVYMAQSGITALKNMMTLGTQTQGWVFDEELGIDVLAQGDNSMLLLLYGVVCLFVIVLFVVLWRSNLKAALTVQDMEKEGKEIPGFADDMKTYLDAKFNRTMLLLPVTGAVIFTVLPSSFSAFTPL